jgi:hypothetical protein
LDEAEGDDKGGVFEVESLLGKRKKNGVDQVKVQWVGYRQTTWEPRENVIDGELLAEFDAAEARAAEARSRTEARVRTWEVACGCAATLAPRGGMAVAVNS